MENHSCDHTEENPLRGIMKNEMKERENSILSEDTEDTKGGENLDSLHFINGDKLLLPGRKWKKFLVEKEAILKDDCHCFRSL